jgi:hypothetical protein
MQLLMGPSKYIVGTAGTYDGISYINIGWPEEFAYSPLIHVEDITGDLPRDNMPSISHGRSAIRLTYNAVLSNMSRTLKLTFLSNESFIVTMIVPAGEISAPAIEGIENVKGQEAGIGYNLSIFQRGGLDITESTYAMMPVQDPSSRFRDRVWTKKEAGIIASISSGSIEKFYKGFGVPSESSTDLQHATVLVAIGASLQSTGEVLEHVLDGKEAITVAVWAKDLRELPKGNVRTFEVCSDRFSLNWYRTTGDDSYGHAIPQEYLDGVLPARFIASGCASWGNLRTSVTQNVTLDGTSSITAKVIGSSITPAIDNWAQQSEFRQGKQPSFTALSAQDFTFTILKPDGTTSTSGLITGNSYVFSNLAWSDIPYRVQIEEDATGNVVETYVILRNPSKTGVSVKNTAYAGVMTQVPPRTAYGEEKYVAPESTECICNDASAINYTAGSGPVDPCGVCFECIRGLLHKDGAITGTNMIKNNGSYTTGASFGNSDGTVVFMGIPAVQGPDISSFLPTTFEIDLFSVSGPGNDPTGAALVAINTHYTSGYTFTGLASGWYMVNIYYTGLTCDSKYWFFVAEEEVQTACNTDVDISIDPCTAMFNGTFDATDVLTYKWTIGGNLAQLPVQVNPGDLVSLEIKFTNGCHDFNWDYKVTPADLDCPSVEQWPTGCTDPTALNFDPTATIDAGTCIYGIRGCMDSSASNFNPQATVNDQSMCLYLCSDPIISSVDTSGAQPVVNFYQPLINYTVTWFSPYLNIIETVEDSPMGPVLGDGAYLVTVVTSEGCTETTSIGLNTDLVFGCMDPLAENFLPAANLPVENWMDGLGELATDPCAYRVLGNPCIPKELQENLTLLDRCLKKALDLYYARLKAGMLTPCFEKDLKTAALIRSVLHRRGLECLFNCKDSSTPDSPGPSCGEKWSKGGPSGEELIFDAAVQYAFNDIVLHPDEFYYIYSSQLQIITDPLTYHIDNPWKRCTEPRLLHGDNHLDAYLSFLRKFCLDCGILPSSVKVTEVESIDEEPAQIEGESMTIQGNKLIL